MESQASTDQVVEDEPIVGLDEVGAFCADVLLDGKTAWIHRRKETVEVHSETLLRHQVSVDFNIHKGLRAPAPEVMAYAPLMLLRKEPGRFLRFDVIDEGGRSLPLPTRARNAQVSSAALIAAARRVLGRQTEKPTLPPRIEAELDFIASSEKDLALAFVRDLYDKPSPASGNAHTTLRATLMKDADFAWALETLAYSSIVLLKVVGEPGTRRIIKMSYDELIEDVTVLRKRPLVARLGALGYRLGWRGYLVQVLSPFIGARSYHFELQSPEGLILLRSGMADKAPVGQSANRAHIYVSNAERERTGLVYGQFRVRGSGFVAGAWFIATLIATTLGLGWVFADELTGEATAGPTLLLVFPGLIATYLARPAHPLVTRLLDLARGALIASATVAFAGAARLAVANPEHPFTAYSAVAWFRPLTIVAAVMALVLFVAMISPSPLDSPLRRAWRRLTGRAGPVPAPASED